MAYEVIKVEFRTELHARWPVFFDHLRVPWSYEPVRWPGCAPTACSTGGTSPASPTCFYGSSEDWQWEAAPKGGFHVLRRTYASIMPEAGESVVTLARWLGHSSPAVTLGYYAHFMPEAGSKGRTAIDGLLGREGDEDASRNSPDSPQG